MMNLQPYTDEIFRRSAERIQKRRQLRNRVLMLCIPLVLTVALVIPKQNAKELAQDAPMETPDYSTGSIACSFVKAQLQTEGKTVAITDKLTVDKLYFMLLDADGADREYSMDHQIPMEPETVYETLGRTDTSCTLTFQTAEGAEAVYYLTQEQFDAVMEVLK